ncbi:MAG: hypothetical protein RLZZ215_1354 [Pseudomonadota bacterium]|jgi:hypothetical protein
MNNEYGALLIFFLVVMLIYQKDKYSRFLNMNYLFVVVLCVPLAIFIYLLTVSVWVGLGFLLASYTAGAINPIESLNTENTILNTIIGAFFILAIFIVISSNIDGVCSYTGIMIDMCLDE